MERTEQTMKQVVVTALILGALAAPPVAAASPAGNPCGGKAMNPCGGKAMNPCGGKAQILPVAFNPDHAEMGTIFYLADPMKRDTVTFSSTAPLEDIVGTSNEIGGYLVFDPRRPQSGGVGRFSIPVSSLATGIPLRDQHLLGDDWLDAKRYPTIDVEIKSIKNVRRVKSGKGYETWEATLTGTLSLHGKTKRMRFPARVTYLRESEQTSRKMPGNLLAGRTTFKVPLEEFGITGPSGMELIGSKVGQEIEIEISFVASDRAPAGAAMPSTRNAAMNPCGGKAQAAPNPCGGKAAMNMDRGY